MLNSCDYCGHVNGHAYGCPEAPEPKPLYHCDECGAPIYIGEEAYQIGGYGSSKYICTQCCGLTEIEAPEPDEDFMYDKWRDDNL